MRSVHTRVLFVLSLLAVSCEKIPIAEAEASNLTWEQEQVQLMEEGFCSEQHFRHPSISEEQYQGAINAVKKAYQLTDISFSPLQPIAFNKGTYQPGYTYKGMIYSSVKEIGAYVGNNVSFYTFMTAIHNPRSKIYTDRIDKSPYHGTNCRSYYGVVCSSLVSYSLGLSPIHSSYDFVASEEMEELDYSDIDNFHIADVLWRSGHVALITNVVRDKNDNVVSLEISESIQSGCRRYSVAKSAFEKSVASKFEKALRYTHLNTNINYTPASEFVTVFDESPVPFEFNEDICVDKGDKSCYFVGEDVVLNLSCPNGKVEIYKEDVLLSEVEVDSVDLPLTGLAYGSYQARIIKDDFYSDFTSWIVVDKTIVPSSAEMKLYFKSENSTPLSIFFCNKSGGRSYPLTDIICQNFTDEEIAIGCMELSPEKMKADRSFFIVTFSTEYGNITTTPIKWD